MQTSGHWLPSPVLLLTLLVGLVVGLAGWNWSTARKAEELERASAGEVSNAMTRQQAIDQMAALGAQAVPEVLRQLASDDVKQRRDAAQVLARLGSAAAPAAAALDARLDDHDADVRELAIIALTEAGQFQPARAARVVAHLCDRNSEVRRAAADYLTAIDLPALEEALTAAELPARDHRHMLIEQARRTGRCDNQLVSVLRQTAFDAELPHLLRADAYEFLGWFDALTLEDTLAAVQSRTADLTALAVAECARLGPAAAAATEQVAEMLDYGDAWVDMEVFAALAAFGPAGQKAIPKIEAVLASGRSTDRIAAWRTLVVLGAERGRLSQVLRPQVEAMELNPELAAILAEVDPQAAREAAVAVGQILDRRAPPDCHRALDYLAALGPSAEPALPAVMRYLRPEPQFKHGVLAALRAVGPAAAPALPVVLRWLDAAGVARASEASAIADALAGMGPAAGEALPRLLALWRETEHQGSRLSYELGMLRLALLRAISAIDHNNADLPAILTALLESDDHGDQILALRVLALGNGPRIDGVPCALRVLTGPDTDFAGSRLHDTALRYLQQLPEPLEECVDGLATFAADVQRPIAGRILALEALKRHAARSAAASPRLQGVLQEDLGSLVMPLRLTGRSVRSLSAWSGQIMERRQLRDAARRAMAAISAAAG
jgi:hypothetical protein